MSLEDVEGVDVRDLSALQREILVVLACEGPMSQGDLHKALQRRFGRDVAVSTVYNNFNDLAAGGYAERRPNVKRPRYTHYALTDRGRYILRQLAQRYAAAVEALEPTVVTDGGQEVETTTGPDDARLPPAYLVGFGAALGFLGVSAWFAHLQFIGGGLFLVGLAVIAAAVVRDDG